MSLEEGGGKLMRENLGLGLLLGGPSYMHGEVR